MSSRLALSMLRTKSAEDNLKAFFLFPQKIRFDISSKLSPVVKSYFCYVSLKIGFDISCKLEMVGCGEGVVYLTAIGHLTDIGLQLGKACYPCRR